MRNYGAIESLYFTGVEHELLEILGNKPRNRLWNKSRYQIVYSGQSHIFPCRPLANGSLTFILFYEAPMAKMRVWIMWTLQYLIRRSVLRSRHDNVIKWKHFPRCWPFVREFTSHRWLPLKKASDAALYIIFIFCVHGPLLITQFS